MTEANQGQDDMINIDDLPDLKKSHLRESKNEEKKEHRKSHHKKEKNQKMYFYFYKNHFFDQIIS